MFEMDFSEKRTGRQATLCQEDLQFLKKMEEGIRQAANRHYEMPLPFQGNTPKLPDNKSLALRQLNKLKTRMENDMKYRQDYMAFIQDIIEKGFAERVPHEQRPDDDEKLWYIPITECITLKSLARSELCMFSIAVQPSWATH